MGYSRNGPIYEGVKLASVLNPADVIVVTENSLTYSWLRNNLVGTSYYTSHDSALQIAYRYFPETTSDCLQMYDWPDSAARSGLKGQGFVSGRHQGGVNNVFTDGHSKWMKTGAEFCRPIHGYVDPTGVQ